jgi:hypothetical protein
VRRLAVIAVGLVLLAMAEMIDLTVGAVVYFGFPDVAALVLLGPILLLVGFVACMVQSRSAAGWPWGARIAIACAAAYLVQVMAAGIAFLSDHVEIISLVVMLVFFSLPALLLLTFVRITPRLLMGPSEESSPSEPITGST